MVELNKDKYIAWLSKKDPQEEVGCPTLCAWCPIAEYLRDIYPDKQFYIRKIYYTYDYKTDKDLPKGRAWLPDWAVEFVSKVDHIGGTYITAAKCLELLK